MSAGKQTHGATRGRKLTPAYISWRSMRERCTPGSASYERNFQNYGARGIAVCGRWETFELFLADMGGRPKGTTIDRIDNSKGYEPGNCRWATKAEQRKNSRTARAIQFRGETLTLAELSAKTGVDRKVLRRRLDRGMSVEEAVSAPVLTHAQAAGLARGGWGGARVRRAS